MPHSHIDVEWYWTFATTREWTADILNKAMALLRRDPDFRFTQDQVVLLRSYWEDLSADDRAFFKQMVVEGRLAIVGGMLVQPEVAEPSGESLVRQILLGQQWLAANLGVRARCGWFIDTFGQIPQLPQLLRQAGFDSYVFWRDIPLEYPVESVPADFYYESPDGTRILTHWLAGGYSFGDAQTRAAVEHSRTRQVLVPYGSDVSRPTEDSSAIRRDMEGRLNKLGIAQPRLRVSTALEYFEALRAEPGRLPVLRMDFNPPQRAQDLRGTYDNRIELKKRNRAAEQALYSAECLAAISSVAGHAYPHAALREMWEKLLFSQFHDIIGGSHSDPVYLGAMARLEWVLTQTAQMAETSLYQIVPGNGETGEWLIVYNTLSFPRSDLCRLPVPPGQLAGRAGLRLQDADGQSIAFRLVDSPSTAPLAEPSIEFIADEVPATGYRAYRLAPGAPRRSALRRKSGPNSFENERFYLEWDPGTGDLTRLRDKRRNRELLASPSNVLIFAQEKNPNLEGNLHLTGQEVCSSAYPVSSIMPGQDDLGLRLNVSNQLPDCLLEREIILWDRMDRIDFRTTLRDFTGGDVLVKVSFAPRLDWRKVERVYETPFAATLRPEGHFAARTWVDCSDGRFGLALLNRGTPGYWIAGGRLDLVLLRSLANYTAYQKSALKKGVPGYEHSAQTELAREHGTHQFEYALVPHRGSWRSGHLPQLGLAYNTPLLGVSGVGRATTKDAGRSFIACSPDFLLTAIKRSEDGLGLTVRGYETRGQAHRVTMRLPREVRRVQRANLLEEAGEALPFSRGRVSFSCRPHEIVTLLLRW
jgi:alpha-mannosidase